MGAKLTQKIFLKIHNSGSPARSNQLKKSEIRKTVRRELQWTLHFTWALKARARDDWSAVDIRVNTFERARARVFFLTAKNEWINWAIINYPIIASEKLTLPYSKIEEKKIKSPVQTRKKNVLLKWRRTISGSPVYYPVEEKLVENHFYLYHMMIVDVEFYACTTYIPMMILLPTRYSIVWLLSWLPNILYRRLDTCLCLLFFFL